VKNGKVVGLAIGVVCLSAFFLVSLYDGRWERTGVSAAAGAGDAWREQRSTHGVLEPRHLVIKAALPPGFACRYAPYVCLFGKGWRKWPGSVQAEQAVLDESGGELVTRIVGTDLRNKTVP